MRARPTVDPPTALSAEDTEGSGRALHAGHGSAQTIGCQTGSQRTGADGLPACGIRAGTRRAWARRLVSVAGRRSATTALWVNVAQHGGRWRRYGRPKEPWRQLPAPETEHLGAESRHGAHKNILRVSAASQRRLCTRHRRTRPNGSPDEEHSREARCLQGRERREGLRVSAVLPCKRQTAAQGIDSGLTPRWHLVGSTAWLKAVAH